MSAVYHPGCQRMIPVVLWAGHESKCAQEQREEALRATQVRNYESHVWDVQDDTMRCAYCEIGQWNGFKEYCHARTMSEVVQ
jgi:hypothetical protein